MSRIGKKPVPVGKAKVTVKDQHIQVEGPKGKLELNVHPTIKVASQEGNLVVTRPDDQKQSKALHGLTRALLANMIEGVTNGYKKSLEVQGVGYKAEMKGKTIVLTVGFANTITLPIPGNVAVQLEGTNKIHVTGADKQAGR
jgi:large subunit ribosomal protein L6